MRVAVIGSGPSGVACAQALIRRGLTPTVIDVGETLPPERQAVIHRMAAAEPADWTEDDRERITANPTISGSDVPKKLVFGSDFYFAHDREFNAVIADSGLPDATFAKGGYSVAWGAAVLPTHDSDLTDWPVKQADLETSYRHVLARVPLSAGRDHLETAFPLFKEQIAPLPLSADASSLLSDLAPVVSEDAEAPFLCGQARLTVDASECRQCGLCLSGCVYGAIHWFGPEVDALAKDGAVRYEPGCFVERLEEDGSGVRVFVRKTATGETSELRFNYVFLAAGALQSTRIVLASLRMFDQPVAMKDSQKFILPLLRARRQPMAWPHNIALASVFADFKVREISDHWIHAQISSVNDYVLRRLRLSPWRAGLRHRLLAPLYERLMIAYCGLHSDHSSGMILTLSAPSQNAQAILHVRRKLNPDARLIVQTIARHLARRLLHGRTLVVTPGLVLGRPGGGNHFGGTLPMRAQPTQRLDTDRLGRLCGWRRIHIVDGAVMPSIPATTIALLLMANADRIATTAEMH